jgi:hypothetical protein
LKGGEEGKLGPWGLRNKRQGGEFPGFIFTSCVSNLEINIMEINISR